MSYARFSSDNWRSDVYCYESDSGFELMVASRRHKDLDTITQIDYSSTERMTETYVQQLRDIQDRDIEQIGLPFDGESYTLGDLEELHAKLLELREVGYHIPDVALTVIQDEMRGEVV